MDDDKIKPIEFLYKLAKSDAVEDEDTSYFQNPPRFEHLIDKNGTHFSVARNVRYWKKLSETKYPINLKDGFKQYKFHFDKCDTKMEEMELYFKKTGISKQKPMTSVCTQQELLNRLMTLPYSNLRNENDRDFTFYATHFCGLLFMVPQTECGRMQLEDTYQLQFEKNFMCDKWLVPEPNEAIDESKKQYAVYSICLKTYRIFYSSTFTGVYSETKLPLKSYYNNFNAHPNLAILMATYLEPCPCVQMLLLSDQYRKTWKDNVANMDWWTKSYLTKTEKVQIGFVDPLGFVNEPPLQVGIKTLYNNEIWKPRVCMKFLHKILKIINDRMFTVDNPHTVYEIKYIGAKNQLEYRIHIGENKFSFLGPEFINYMSPETVDLDFYQLNE